ncbi:hypothetical protein PBAL39_08831 [Pedobacter sp. BAL39]|nr:hypothetical protein PBAL39_08831 [Pedobacter sp. BAL39]
MRQSTYSDDQKNELIVQHKDYNKKNTSNETTPSKAKH